MKIFSALFGQNATKVRKRAQVIELTVADITRELPAYSRDMKSVELTPGACVRYSVHRRGPLPRVPWRLLQRTATVGATFPNDYLLETNGPILAGLSSELRDIANAYPKEYFEFEGTATDVAVFWEEWGTETKADELCAVLERLAQW